MTTQHTQELSSPDRSPFSASIVRNTASGGQLCKVYEYDADREELSCQTSAILTKGEVKSRSFDSIRSFMDQRAELQPSEALMMGLPIYPEASIVTQKALRRIPEEKRRADNDIPNQRGRR